MVKTSGGAAQHGLVPLHVDEEVAEDAAGEDRHRRDLEPEADGEFAAQHVVDQVETSQISATEAMNSVP